MSGELLLRERAGPCHHSNPWCKTILAGSGCLPIVLSHRRYEQVTMKTMTFIRLAGGGSRAITYTPLMNRAGLWRVQNESKNQMGLRKVDSGWSVCRWMASTNHRVGALRSSGSRVVRHHSSTSRTIPTVWLALPDPHALSPACTHDVSRCESESRPATGVSPLASATR